MKHTSIDQYPCEYALAIRPDVTEQLLSGSRRLRQAFREIPYRSLERGGKFPNSGIFLIHRGVVLCASTLPNGRRAILDLLLPGDVAGIDHAVLHRPDRDMVAASILGYRVMEAAAFRRLLDEEPSVMLSVLGLLAEARSRMDRHTAAIARLQARERLCTLLLDVHDRLFRRGLIARPSFALPLTQEQIADYLGLTMVHVNRTLRQLREERLALVDHQVVVALDLPRLREIVQGLPGFETAPTAFDQSEEVMPQVGGR